MDDRTWESWVLEAAAWEAAWSAAEEATLGREAPAPGAMAEDPTRRGAGDDAASRGPLFSVGGAPSLGAQKGVGGPGGQAV